MPHMEKPDYMSDTEYKDLEDMKDKILKIKESTFDYLRDVLRYTETDLLHSGYRNMSIAEAMKKIFENKLADIKKLQNAYIKKYPD